jgi:hypothetical protein
MTLRLCIIASALLVFAGCASKDSNSPASSNSPGSSTTTASPSTNSSAATQPVKSRIDTCSLLTSDDIKSVQGEAYQDAKRSDRQDGDFIIGQCYFALPTTANSVVLNLTTAREGGSTSARKFWETTFARSAEAPPAREKEKEKDREKEKSGERREAGEEESPKPEKIAGLGEDAYWIASQVGGALYVLKGDEFFRISVGGAGDARSKLNKSKTLAQHVLKKL